MRRRRFEFPVESVSNAEQASRLRFVRDANLVQKPALKSLR
jgi:hypothetical protein